MTRGSTSICFLFLSAVRASSATSSSSAESSLGGAAMMPFMMSSYCFTTMLPQRMVRPTCSYSRDRGTPTWQLQRV